MIHLFDEPLSNFLHLTTSTTSFISDDFHPGVLINSLGEALPDFYSSYTV